MSRHEPMPTLASGTADAVLDALPHPVIMVAADGRIANANAAAESFFDASLPLLRRHMLRDLVPFGSPLLALIEQVRGHRRRHHRVLGPAVDMHDDRVALLGVEVLRPHNRGIVTVAIADLEQTEIAHHADTADAQPIRPPAPFDRAKYRPQKTAAPEPGPP